MQDPAPTGETRDHVCKQDDDSQGGGITRSMDDLPEDICRHLHALMPLRDAARMACASHTFLSSWRCHPNLTLSKLTLGLNEDIVGKDEMTRDLISKVDHILKNHSGVGMKKLDIRLSHCSKVDSCYINSWLRIAVAAGIEELTITLPRFPKEPFNFPCSVLFNGSDSSIRRLHIAICAFRPTAGLGCWRSLTELYLTNVCIADDELECLLSICAVLERLGLLSCREIVCLKIPFVLQRLRFLSVKLCRNLQVINSNAPNISTFVLYGSLVPISLGSALQVKKVDVRCLEFGQTNIVWHARTRLLSYVPNVEKLALSSRNEVRQPNMKHDSVIGDSSHLRQLPQHRHNSLKSVAIVGFCSAKSLVELTCHIVENVTSLKRLTLDTSHGCQSYGACTINEPHRWHFTQSGTLTTAPLGRCLPMGNGILMEAPRALLAIRTHIEGIVPSRVVLKVVEPCSQCHDVELLDA